MPLSENKNKQNLELQITAFLYPLKKGFCEFHLRIKKAVKLGSVYLGVFW